MLKKIILHIGLDKTGSTAIQYACAENKDLLLRNSILYPQEHFVAHGQLGSCFYDNPTDYLHNIELGRIDLKVIKTEDEQYLNDLLQELDNTDPEVLLLSAEVFAFMHGFALEKMANYLYTLAKTVEVVLYYRNPISYAVSAKSQRALTGILRQDVPPIQELKFVCDKYKNAFGENSVHVRAFDRKSFPKGDVRLDFFSYLGKKHKLNKKLLNLRKEMDNESLTWEAIQVAETIAKKHLAKPISNFDFSSKYGSLLRQIRGNKISLSESELHNVRKASKLHFDYAKNNFGIEFSEDIFDKPSATITMPASFAESIALLVDELVDSRSKLARLTKPSRENVYTGDIVVELINPNVEVTVAYGEVLRFEFYVLVNNNISNLELGVHIHDENGDWAFGTNSKLIGKPIKNINQGGYIARFMFLVELPIGKYTIGFAFTDRFEEGERQLAWFDEVCSFNVTRNEQEIFAGYSYLPTVIDLFKSELPDRFNVIVKPSGGVRLLSSVKKVHKVGSQYSLEVEVSNLTNQIWSSDACNPVFLSYRWLNIKTGKVEFDGQRVRLPDGSLLPKQFKRMKLAVTSPDNVGDYELCITVLQEEVAWFDEFVGDFMPSVIKVSLV